MILKIVEEVRDGQKNWKGILLRTRLGENELLSG
jgi:hypothetical protein